MAGFLHDQRTGQIASPPVSPDETVRNMEVADILIVLDRDHAADSAVCDRFFQFPEERTVSQHMADRHKPARPDCRFLNRKGFLRHG